MDAIGQPVRPEAYSDRFRALACQAGLPVVRLHSVRHTLGLIMHRARGRSRGRGGPARPQPGGPLRQLSAVIGAASPERSQCSRCGPGRSVWIVCEIPAAHSGLAGSEMSLTRPDIGGSKQTRTADLLFVRQVL